MPIDIARQGLLCMTALFADISTSKYI